MSRNYLGGHTIISAKGAGWSYDPCEVRDEILKVEDAPEGLKMPDRKKQPPTLKARTRKKSRPRTTKTPRDYINQNAKACAHAALTGKERPPRPTIFKPSWLRSKGRKQKFEAKILRIIEQETLKLQRVAHRSKDAK